MIFEYHLGDLPPVELVMSQPEVGELRGEAEVAALRSHATGDDA